MTYTKWQNRQYSLEISIFPVFILVFSMLWKVFRTVQQMLVDRGVVLEEGSKIVENLQDFQHLFGKSHCLH